MNYTFYNIPSSVYIGDSLPTINANYSALNAWVSDKQNDYSIYWKPIIDFYNQNINYIQEALTLVNSNSSIWNDFRTTVETNSAYWLAPNFTIYYPKLIQKSTTNIKNSISEIQSWLNKNFTVQNEDGSVNYVQGQYAIVYAYVQMKDHQINYSAQLMDQTTCNATNQTVCATCQRYSNTQVDCTNTTLHCSYNQYCTTCATGDCHYADTPTTSFIVDPNNNTIAISEIKVNLSMQYTDTREQLYGIIFNVKDCSWQYFKFLGGSSI